MSDKYRYNATVTLVIEVSGDFEDDEHTVIDEQARSQAIDDAGLTFIDDDVEVNLRIVELIQDESITPENIV